MTLEISVDFQEQSINLMVDNTLSINAFKESDGSITYQRLTRIESEDTQDILKSVCEQLFSIEEL
jgi:hypothetical protein